jgi:hypothetical protein
VKHRQDLVNALREQIELGEALREKLREVLPGDTYELIQIDMDESLYARDRARRVLAEVAQ